MGLIRRTVEIDADLLAVADARGVEQPIAKDAAERARRWAEENAEAIAAYNERIAARGVFGDDFRRW